MPSDCDTNRTIVSALIGDGGVESGEVTEEAIESAFRHLKRCSTCRSALSAEERARFIRNVILQRE